MVMKSQVVQEVNEWGALERNDLGSGGNELLAISSGDLRAVYPCRFCQIFRTWNA